MQITVYSVFTTVIWSSLLIIIYSVIRNNNVFIDVCGISGIIALYSFCAIRLFLPIEFSWTKVVTIEWLDRLVEKVLFRNACTILKNDITVEFLLFVVWIVIAIIKLVYLLSVYIVSSHKVAKLDYIRDVECEQIVEGFEYSSPFKCKVLRLGLANSPASLGIFRPTILLPKADYSEKELKLVLEHEYIHICNQDYLVKFLVNLLCAIYWWNPLVYIFRRNLESYFELRCDQMIVTNSKTDDTIIDYMEILLKQYKVANDIDGLEPISNKFIGSLYADRLFRERLMRLKDYQSKTSNNYYGKHLAVFFMILMLVVSYIFNLQAAFEPNKSEIEINDGTHEVTIDNSYIVHKNSQYIFVTDYGYTNVISEKSAKMLIQDGFEVKEK